MRPLLRLLVMKAVLVLTMFGPAEAQQRSFWLVNASSINASSLIEGCAGRHEGKDLRAANGNNGWILITAAVTCKDAGDGFEFKVDYVSVEVNPRNRSNIQRDPMIFDWLALAVFRPKDSSGERIDWLYDQALPVHGSLAKNGREKIYFGNLVFPKIARADLVKATNFTFYLTSQGVPFVFGLNK